MLALRLYEDGLRLEEIDEPVPGAGDVLVRVHAAAITRGELEWPADRLPAVVSYELSGVAVDSGEDRMVYAGPVLSHYEFEMPGVTRKSDSEWGEDLQRGWRPPRPEWTRGYLVPR